MHTRRTRAVLLPTLCLFILSATSAGCASLDHPHAPRQTRLAGAAAGAALGAALDHRDRGRGALIGGIGGLVLGAIFANEIERHRYAHGYHEPERVWCPEHQQWEVFEPPPDDDAYPEDDPEARGVDVESPDGAPVIVIAPPDVLFDPGSTRLSSGAQSSLQRLADTLRDRDDLEVVLRGHTAESSRERDPFELSERRAEVVRAFLEQEGVPRRRMNVVGLGAARPVATNRSPEGRQRNRRVEVVLRERV